MLSKSVHYSSVFLVLCCVFNLAGCTSEAVRTPVQTPSHTEWVNTCVDWDDWDKPSPPFRIYGNSYYVGTCGITAILVTGNNGHILIDGATEAGADVIAENIKALGFSLNDVKLLLHSHEHFDHVAGLAKLQKLSDAKLLASLEAAPVLRSGITADVDPQAGMHEPFPPARVDGIIKDGEVVELGNLALTSVATPGHSHGALSWQWRSCEKERCLSIVYADSLSPVSRDNYHFSDHPNYVEAYQNSLNKIAGLDCQILMSPHPSSSQMRTRLSSPEGLIDPKGCIVYADNVSTRLNKRLIKEQKEKAQ
ncbi:MAG: subclass B3 metallo-beta-lactamase [Alteromonadaceae bacterium]|nr:MAG: subclass B3 metallo-beta-lactamase [Alteromonadaceae bacterium]